MQRSGSSTQTLHKILTNSDPKLARRQETYGNRTSLPTDDIRQSIV